MAAEHLQAELIEIDENLCRSELTASQRSGYTKRRKEIWEALNPEPSPDYGQEDGAGACTEESGTTCPTLASPKTGRGNTQFAAETAAITGQSKRTINRNVARAEALGDDLPEVSARRHYIEAHCLASIRPKTRDEAKAVLRFMAAHEMFDRNETDAVLENLVG
ncbi:hypothetical protein [Simplicispira metamorpha]|uniref:Uncharacterized protein n=1 Tax=Simplicispira metamorpha TaxID=80881 RepID=A0A4R2NEQ7_9BURK|nr:hypothetical protein [Simplicispira metamorpha]TCP19544.1 hypothetical protein EV674_1041 [Simplicispira metamorpha]